MTNFPLKCNQLHSSKLYNCISPPWKGNVRLVNVPAITVMVTTDYESYESIFMSAEP